MNKVDEKIFYDKKTDTLWLLVKPGVEEKHQEIAPGVSIELNKKGEVLGIEILNASKTLGSKIKPGNSSLKDAPFSFKS